MSNLALYIHIPFCTSKCFYCDFYSLADKKEQIGPYVNALIRDIKLWGEKLNDKEIDTIYFGGGTPSFIGEKHIETILTEINKNFFVKNNAEITLEANPDSASDEFLKSIYLAGVNRISFGVQSFDDEELKLLGRVHNKNEAILAVENAKKAGFQNISIDLMFAIPNQTLNSFEKSIEMALSLKPQHISAYALKLEEGTPLYLKRKNLNLANEEIEFQMFELLSDTLEKNGYSHYEISNFALPNFESRHNKKYWSGVEYLGLGTAAHSFLNQNRFCEFENIGDFLKEKRTGETILISKEESIKEYMMLGLRQSEGISLKRLSQIIEKKCFDELMIKAKKFEKLGFGKIENDFFNLNLKGFWLSNSVINEFFGILDK
jgi:putative oxygen-independent coproporphyrinogen III oxidase